jgi:hypothetical protein
MGLSIAARGARALGSQVWEIEVPPHQVRLFGECRRTEGPRSVLLVSDVEFDEQAGTLTFDMEGAVPLNVGTTSIALAVGNTAPRETRQGGRSHDPVVASLGSGDQEFLSLARALPPDGYAAAEELLFGVRSEWPGDLKRGLRQNFSETPDNFWYVVVQPRAGELSVTVRGEPEAIKDAKLPLKQDRPGYSRFKVRRVADVPLALAIIRQSRRK